MTVTAANNAVDAPDRTVTVSGTASGGGVAAPADRTLTITDDEGVPTVSLVLSKTTIGEDGGASTVTAELSHASSATVTVEVSAAAVLPAVAADFTQAGTTLTIAPGATESTGTVTVTAVNNAVDAPDKTLTLAGTASGGGVSAPADRTLTITDDDEPAWSVVAVPLVIAETGGVATLTVSTGGVTFATDRAIALDLAGSTATAGIDFALANGSGAALTSPYDLTLRAAESSARVTVTALDDVVDEGDERVEIAVRHGNSVMGAQTVTITNHGDPMPKAWLVRFGRKVAGHVVDAVEERLTGPSSSGSHVTLGGQRLSLGGNGKGLAEGAARSAFQDDYAAARGGLEAFADRIAGDADSASRAWDGWTRDGSGNDTWQMEDRELLLGSSFHLGLGGDEDSARGANTRWTAWGKAATTHFDGEAKDLALDGSVITFTLGADAAWARWLAGVAVSLSAGEGGFRDDVPAADHEKRVTGDLETTLTSVHPYLRYEASERLSVWGILGYGTGELTLTVDGSRRLTTDTAMEMAAAGVRGVLVPAEEVGDIELSMRTDAMLTHMTSEAAAGEAGLFDATKADTSRLRLTLEGSRSVTMGDEGMLRPSLEVGLRRDGGDAESGTGIEIGGRLTYTDPASGLTVDAKVRGLVAYEGVGYMEWGASGLIRIDPSASGQGLSLTVAPAWGADAGGAERLWSLDDARELAAGEEFDPAGRLEVEAGYGLTGPRGLGVATPYIGLALSGENERTWRTGVRWQVAPAVMLGFEGTRREPANDHAPEHGLMLRAGMSW